MYEQSNFIYPLTNIQCTLLYHRHESKPVYFLPADQVPMDGLSLKLLIWQKDSSHYKLTISVMQDEKNPMKMRLFTVNM